MSKFSYTKEQRAAAKERKVALASIHFDDWHVDGGFGKFDFFGPVDSPLFKRVFGMLGRGVARYGIDVAPADPVRDQLLAACEEFRESVLNGRHQLESPCLDPDQTNAVLSLFDDMVVSAIAAARGEGT